MREKEIENEIKIWLEMHNHLLPPNAKQWLINVYSRNQSMSPNISLGKYDASLRIITPFYKPYSKIFKL